MSLGRRSDRVRKKVDYAKFCQEEDNSSNNSDDDFQDEAGLPSAKKTKSKVKPNVKSKREETKGEESGSLKRKERLSRDEKLYQKELEAALKASIEDSEKSSGHSTANDNQEEFSDNEIEVASSRSKKPRLLPPLEIEDNDKENNGSGSHTNTEKKVQGIEGEERSNDDSKKQQSRKTSDVKKEVLNQEQEDDGLDSDFEHSEELSNEESVSECDDSDFDEETELKKTKKGKGQGRSAASSPAKPTIKPRTSVTVTPIKMLRGKGKGKMSSANSSHSVSSSASNSPSIVTTTKHQPLKQVKVHSTLLNKNSPGMQTVNLGGVKINHTGPPIRLGLSRNVRVKPLHSHLSVQQ